MMPEKSPFPSHWWGTALNNAGLENIRPRVGTYGCYDYAMLPPVPFVMRGEFEWLAVEPVLRKNSFGIERVDENAIAIKSLRKASDEMGVKLPREFVGFMETPMLHQRIRSNTDCFLDLCPCPILSPIGDGYLIRFLADSQGCIFWYLYLTSDGIDQAVVASPGYYGINAEQWREEPPDPSDLVYCAESFETFICRFWLENEIWFAGYEKTPMPKVGKQYIEQYRLNAKGK